MGKTAVKISDAMLKVLREMARKSNHKKAFRRALQAEGERIWEEARGRSAHHGMLYRVTKARDLP
ncbi:hypothetical protein LCGC14_1698420 [marine sediment metagenome]|uniref:Uncharacterized protein n=1 Tax=marine sediment metagenome TaxID=412755 RepID=A0A0F9HJ90_9ZZZZ